MARWSQPQIFLNFQISDINTPQITLYPRNGRNITKFFV